MHEAVGTIIVCKKVGRRVSSFLKAYDTLCPQSPRLEQSLRLLHIIESLVFKLHVRIFFFDLDHLCIF